VIVPVVKLLLQVGEVVVLTTTEYAPAVEVAKLETFPGFKNPDGTVQT
jgi:hypothetical protein